MSRTAIAILLLCALGAFCLGTYFALFPRAGEIQLEEATKGLTTAGRLLQEMDLADEGRLTRKLAELALRPGLLELLRRPPVDPTARQAWLVKLRAEVAGLAAAVREASPVKDFFVLDTKGIGVVRNIDLHWTGLLPTADEQVNKAIERALAGYQQALIFAEGNQLMRAVVVPVTDKGRMLGALLASFPFDDALAKARSSQLPLDVRFAYVTKQGMPSKNLSVDEQKTLRDILSAQPAALERLLSGKRLEIRTAKAAGRRWRLAGFPVLARGGTGLCGLVLLRSLADLDRPLTELALYLFGGAGLLFVLLTTVTLLFGGQQTRSLKALEQELLDVVHSGQRRAVKGPGPAIVRSLAALMSQITTGQAFEDPRAQRQDKDELPSLTAGFYDEEDDEVVEAFEGHEEEEQDAERDAALERAEETEGPARGESVLSTAGGSDASDSPPAPQSAADPEKDYYWDIFVQFRDAKEQLGESLGRLKYERFRAKLDKQAELIKAKHGCKAVRFEVMIRSGKVSLLPKIIR